jgi:hypothetical protein
VALMSVRAVADLFDPHVPSCSVRYLELVMDGLRPGGRPWTHEPMSTPQLAAVLVGR